MQLSEYFFAAGLLLTCALASPDVLHYKPLTPEEAEAVASWTPDSLQAMWELSGQFEGDMVINTEVRNGLIDTTKRWPNKVIPYEISNDFTAEQKRFISESLQKEFARTCITVRPRQGEVDYVYVTGDNSGCWSEVGRIGGKQTLNLKPNGCLSYGTIVHEFLHAAGFYHQQSATDRDNWVTILKENIIKDKEHNFNKYPASMITSFGLPYDYNSIMHYGMYAFSKNNQPTIAPKDKNASIGQRKELSNIDIAKANKMYNCA